MRNIFFIGALAVGCAKSQPATVTVQQQEVPAWAMSSIKGCGVGIQKLGVDLGLTRDAAVASGRADLARSLKTTVHGVIQDYVQEGSVDGASFSEELVTSTVQDVVNMTLMGTQIKKSNAIGDQFYALVCIDVATFSNTFTTQEKLPQVHREGLRKRAADAFKELDAEIDKL